jgi:integrase
MPKRLTDTAIAKALRDAAGTGARSDLSDAGQPGLRLRVTPAGGATWVLACRDQRGRMRRFMLGRYPALGLSVAREEARAMHYRVRQEGADPTAERREERARAALATDGANTLAGLLDLYEQQRGGKLRSWQGYRRSIGKVFGKFMGLPLVDLHLAGLQLTADRYPAQANASLAVRCLRPVLKWAAAPGRAYLPADLIAIAAPATPRRRQRVLSRSELAVLLPVLRASERPFAAALRLILLTLLRREEAAGARWRDVDWQAGTLAIPAERSKNGQPHIVPLPQQAMALLRERLPADGEPAPNRLIFSTGTGAPFTNWDRETKRIQVNSGTDGWTRHDLRRTGATMLGEMGELPDIIEAALNHVAIRSPLAATYNRSRYRPQVAKALQRLADALDGIEAGSAVVTPLRGDASR